MAALAGFVAQALHIRSDQSVAHFAFGAFAIVTIAFWIYFYVAPRNRVRKAVRDSLDYAGTYLNSSNDQIDVYENEFAPSSFGVKRVSLPPFETVPTVTIFAVGETDSLPPEIVEVMLEAFDVRAQNTNQFRTWRFRARGLRLRRMDGESR